MNSTRIGRAVRRPHPAHADALSGQLWLRAAHLSPDGDPLDALVIARSPFVPGCVVRARPIAVLNLEDESGGDEKLVCVPDDKTFPYYHDVSEKGDLPEIVLQQIEHFFTHYKDLEKEKWVRVGTWGGAEDARKITIEAIERYNEAKAAKEAAE
jgi:inorganic pyrophosphatase